VWFQEQFRAHGVEALEGRTMALFEMILIFTYRCDCKCIDDLKYRR